MSGLERLAAGGVNHPPIVPTAGVGKRSAVVVGGGFFGCSLAIFLKEKLGFNEVRVLERSSAILGRASYYNQARVHNGYHYPRSYTTAYRSRINLPKFVSEFEGCIDRSFTKIYAIPYGVSKVTGRQFVRFCKEIGARLDPVPPRIERLFNPRLVEAAFVVDEYAFDAAALAAILRERMDRAGVDLKLNANVIGISDGADGSFAGRPLVRYVDTAGAQEAEADLVLNCTYAGLSSLGVDLAARLKFEITELAIVEVPDELRGLGITVMDGAFFSLMPFPARGLHSLSHVRYTPHLSWSSDEGEPLGKNLDPYEVLERYGRPSRFDMMRRDASRYMPIVGNVRQIDSHFEVKTVLVANEGDDGRPILFETSRRSQRVISILGGKLDNIYDAYEALKQAVRNIP
jgi:glycine/D-amino acid oxidase-like deaminating enzyme